MKNTEKRIYYFYYVVPLRTGILCLFFDDDDDINIYSYIYYNKIDNMTPWKGKFTCT